MPEEKKSKSSPKTDAMRAQREARIKEAEKRRGEETPPRAPTAAIDDVINEAGPDPNGRGGKVKIKVPKPVERGKTAKTKARRDEFPVPTKKRSATTKAGDSEKRRIRCKVCKRMIMPDAVGRLRPHLCASGVA